MSSVIDIIDALGEVFPWELAPEGDGGLLLGSPGSAVDRVMCSIDLNLETVRRAVESGCAALVVHHPHLLRRAGSPLAWETPAGAIVREACLAGLNMIGCHANADLADRGAADTMARKLGLLDAGPLERAVGVYIAKVVVFVPPEALEAVSDAMSDAGAGIIGDYTHCGFRSEGKGSFMPGPRADPYSGRPGELNLEVEVRLEMRVPSFRVPGVVAAMLGVHPYEEVAYDVYRTEDQVPWGRGRIGDLPGRRRVGELADELAAWCASDLPDLYGRRDREAGRVAVVPGAANRLVPAALSAGAELLVTGELDWHHVTEARAGGMAVLCLGHLASERHLIPVMVERLQMECGRRGLSVAVEGYKDQEGRWG